MSNITNAYIFPVEDYKIIATLINGIVGYQLCPSYYAMAKNKLILRPKEAGPANEAGTDIMCAMQPLLEHTG